MGYGLNALYFFDNSLVAILLLGIRLLWILMIVSIIAGIAVEAKRRGWDKYCLSIFRQINSYNGPNIYLCTNCGRELSSDWQYCPGCSSPLRTKSGVEKIDMASETEEVQPQAPEEPAIVQKEENFTDNPIEHHESNNNTTVQKPRKKKSPKNGKSNSSL